MGLQSSHVRDKFLKIHFWDLATRKPLGKVQFPVEKTSIPFVTFSKNGLAAIVWDKIIHVLDLKTVKGLGQYPGPEEFVSYLPFSMDGGLLVSGSHHRA